MQDEIIQKSQQIANHRQQYHKKPDQGSFKNNQKRSKGNKFNCSASEYLSFKVDKKETLVKTFKPKVQTNNEITLSPYYRFALQQADYREYHSDPNLPLDWDVVRKVRILTDSEVKCPVCLEEQLLVGRANKCGHYYCWPCVIRYMWVTEAKKRCPVCNCPLKSIDLRPVELKVYKHISEGKSIDLVLVKRSKGSISLFEVAKSEEMTCSGLVSSQSPNTWLNKMSIYTELEQDYLKEKEMLNSALSQVIDDFEKNSILKALELLEKNWGNQERTSQFALESKSEGFYYFYQVSDYLPYFLHPLNMAMLKKQFSSFELCPLQLHCKILEIESIHITENEQRKFGQLAHLGKNVIAYFLEVDLRGVVSSQVLDDYKQEVIFKKINKRQKDRARFKRIEDKIQKKISIRRKNEEEANNLLLSYFENPVVAPVLKVVEKQKIEKNEKEEKKENDESLSSKSIWSKFGEVLKRPPREKNIPAVTEKEPEDDEESPKKLTMFDLIKNKSH